MRTSDYLIVAGLLLGSALPAFGQEEPAPEEPPAAPQKREHRDIMFASSLAAYTWYDLAFEVLDDLEKSRPGAEVIESAQILRAELKTEWASSLKDPAKRADVLKEVRVYYEEIVQKKKGSEAATAAQLALGKMLIQEGDSAFTRVRLAEDPDSRAIARKEADEAFAKAERYFEELVKTFEKQKDDAEKGSDKAKVESAHYKLGHALYSHALSIFQHAQLFDRGSKDRDDRIAKAAGMFEEINVDYGDMLIGYEAGIRLGLCQKDLGDSKKAYAAFDSVLGIKDVYPQNEQGKPVFDQPGADIVSRASYFKAQTLNEIREFDGALAAVKELFELLPDTQRHPLGYAARVEQGKAYAGKGDLKKAQEVLEKVADDDKNGPWAQSAKEQLTLLGSGGGGVVVVAPDRTLNAAEASIDRGKPAEGLNQIRFLIGAIEGASEEEKAKWLPVCWYRLGSAYAGLKRYDEAAVCFDALVARFKASEQAPAALFQAAMVRSQLNGIRPNDFDKNAYLDTLKKLQSDYPNAQESKASGFFTGMERFSARDYEAAAREFERTSPTAGKLYDAAIYQAALSHYMLGNTLARDKKDDLAKAALAQARLAFDKVVRWSTQEGFEKGGVPKEGDRADTLKKMAFDARCRLAEMALHPLIRDAEKALAAARAAEGGIDKADPERIATARLLMVKAHLATDDVAKAEEVVASMGTDAGQSQKTAQAEREVAVDVDELGRVAQKAKKDDEAKALFAKAADHYFRWYEVSEKAGAQLGPKDISRAANRLYALALVLNGLPENTESFSEAPDLAKLEAPTRFVEAAKVGQGAIAAGASDAELRVLVGQCQGFAQKFDLAAKALSEACNQEKLITVVKEKDEQGKMVDIASVDVKIASAKPMLLTAYADYGRCCYELGLKDRKYMDEAVAVWGRVLGAVQAGHSLWWRGKYFLFAALYEKGEYDDAAIGMKQLQRQNPSFENNRFGLKERFETLAKKLEGKKSPPKPAGAGTPAGGKKDTKTR